jgi:hypothetical protein
MGLFMLIVAWLDAVVCRLDAARRGASKVSKYVVQCLR